MSRVLLLSDNDNVVTFLEEGKKGTTVYFERLTERTRVEVQEDIPFGHKMANMDIKAGEKIIKYGEVIGQATEKIQKGFHAHVHNIESLRVRHDLEKED